MFVSSGISSPGTTKLGYSIDPPLITLKVDGPRFVPKIGSGDIKVTELPEGNRLWISPIFSFELSKLIESPASPISATPFTLPPEYIVPSPLPDWVKIILEKYKKYVL